MFVLLEGSPISTEEFWSSVRVTIGFLVTSQTKAFLLRLFSLAGQPALGRALVVRNFFHLRMMEATVFFRTSMRHKCFGTLSQICASTQSCLGALRTIPLTSWLVFFCSVNCWILYRQASAFPKHVQSIEFTTGRLQPSY